MTPNLIVGLVDGDGKLITFQPYEEYQHGKRSNSIVIPCRGKRLFEILCDDLGNISYENNRFVLKHILHSNINTSVMTLLGKIAEAVLVKRCQENEQINKDFFQIATKKSVYLVTSRKYTAIGTGLQGTSKIYPQRYNPTDPQRDIIWVDSQGKPALMAGANSQSGIIAGLQIKVSLHGVNYLLSDLLSTRYEVPIIYFPLRNDYEQIVERLEKELKKSNDLYNKISISNILENFIDIRAHDYEACEEIMDYYPLIYDLIDGNIEVADLVDIAVRHRDPTLKNAVMMSALDSPNIDSIVLQ